MSLMKSPLPLSKLPGSDIKSTQLLKHRRSVVVSSSKPSTLKRIHTLSALSSPKSQAYQPDQILFDLRVENFGMKFNINKIRSEIDEPSSGLSSFREEELQEKIVLIRDFEENWGKICKKYETLSTNKEKFESDLTTLSATLKTLRTDITKSEKNIKNLKSKQTDMTEKAKELETEYTQLLLANQLGGVLPEQPTEKKVSKEVLKRRLEKILSEHKSHMQQLNWEEEQLKPGVETLLRNVRQARGLLESKSGIYNKLQAQLNELTAKN